MFRTTYKSVIVVKDKVCHLKKNEMHSVLVSPHLKKQFGLDICSLPEENSYRHLIVCGDYIIKWLEANPIRGQSNIPNFLYISANG